MEEEKILTAIHFLSMHSNLYLLFFKDLSKKNILINNIRVGVADTKIHKKN